MKKLKEKWKRLTSNKFELTLFERDGEGTQFEDKVYLSKISKISNTHFKGLDMNGNRIEYRAERPFSYRIIQLY